MEVPDVNNAVVASFQHSSAAEVVSLINLPTITRYNILTVLYIVSWM